MKNPFSIGDQKEFLIEVEEKMLARFERGLVHPVYSTFWLAYHAEWTGRLFVLEMLEAGEEGIGTQLGIEHLSPALLGDQVRITAVLESVDKAGIQCSFDAKVGQRLIAIGSTGQKIIRKARFDAYLATLQGKKA